jgi:signal transduction histidine kinase
VRLDAGISHVGLISVAELLGEVEIAASIQAQARDQHLAVAAPHGAVTVRGDWQILAAALANLLHNAFKFTPAHGHISLAVRVDADRVAFDIEDECGGLPPGKVEDLFQPYSQRGADRSGIVLGLTICRKAATASGGELRVRNLPGKGCVFTLDLPRQPAPPLSVVGGGSSSSAENAPTGSRVQGSSGSKR